MDNSAFTPSVLFSAAASTSDHAHSTATANEWTASEISAETVATTRTPSDGTIFSGIESPLATQSDMEGWHQAIHRYTRALVPWYPIHDECAILMMKQEYAFRNPHTYVLGMDTYLPQPQLQEYKGIQLQNWDMIMHDYANGPTLPPDYLPVYDVIRCTRLNGRVNDWPFLCSKMFRNLKVGGYAEVYDISRFHGMESHAWRLVPALFRNGGNRIGRPFSNGHHIKIAMLGSGFIRVRETRRCIAVPNDTFIGWNIIDGLVQDVVHILRLFYELDEEVISRYAHALRQDTEGLTLETYEPIPFQ
ncbi:hypothetical protein VM1G_10395 [Cytospora mali]|uniref:Methyltransferase domain-containing protein n=1 Tax=Cytospora mali TaxID=578113 RepID=A0A194VHH9_CYTMA|nr:hypothetical protein VM1G_10395 [Valsa mali]